MEQRQQRADSIMVASDQGGDTTFAGHPPDRVSAPTSSWPTAILTSASIRPTSVVAWRSTLMVAGAVLAQWFGWLE